MEVLLDLFISPLSLTHTHAAVVSPYPLGMYLRYLRYRYLLGEDALVAPHLGGPRLPSSRRELCLGMGLASTASSESASHPMWRMHPESVWPTARSAWHR